MTPFGYTILGFGGGKAPPVPIAEDLTYSIEALGVTGSACEIALDPYNENKCLLGYKDSGNDGVLYAGTIDGDVITLGSEVEIGGIYAQQFSIDFDPNVENSFICCYQNYVGSGSSNIAHFAVAGTLSGTTITIGSTTNISSAETNDYISGNRVKFNPNRAGQCAVCCTNWDNATRGGALEVKSLTVSGTAVTLVNTYNVHTTDACYEPTLWWDSSSADMFFMAYKGGGDHGYITPATINSSDVIALGTENQFNTSPGSYTMQDGASDDNNPGKFVVIYTTNSREKVYVVCGNLSAYDGTISFGTAVLLEEVSGGPYYTMPKIEMDKNTPNKFYAIWSREINDSAFRGVVGTLDGTSISVGTIETIKDGNNMMWPRSLVRDPYNPGRFFTFYNQSGDSDNLFVTGSQIASFEL